MGLIKKLRKAKKAAPPNEKPAVVKTHLRNMIVVPEMIGSVVGIYNGKVFNSVEIKPEMTGHYLAEFSCSYKPVKHGRPGVSPCISLSWHKRLFIDVCSERESRLVRHIVSVEVVHVLEVLLIIMAPISLASRL
jgi:ribosomal protein S19